MVGGQAQQHPQPPAEQTSSSTEGAFSVLGFWVLTAWGQLSRLPSLHTEVKWHYPQDPTPLYLGDPLNSHGGQEEGTGLGDQNLVPTQRATAHWVMESGTVQEDTKAQDAIGLAQGRRRQCP